VYFYKNYLIKKKIYRYNVFEFFGVLSCMRQHIIFESDTINFVKSKPNYDWLDGVTSPNAMDPALARLNYDWIGQFVKS